MWYWIGPHWEHDRLVSQPKWSRRAVPEALLPRRTAAPPPVPRTGKSREGQAGPFPPKGGKVLTQRLSGRAH